MARISKVAHCICLIGLIAFACLSHAQPGKYHGLIDGSVTVCPSDDSQVYEYYDIRFHSETRPTWRKDRPTNFSYDYIDLTFNYKTKATVYFPSLKCLYGTKESTFSKALLKDLLITNSEAKSDTIISKQIDQLFGLITSAGVGTFPNPRHHPYYVESPLRGSFFHSCSGFSPGPGFGVLILIIGGILWFVGFSRTKDASSLVGERRQATRLVSLVVIAVLTNYGLFFFGMFLGFFDGTIGKFGASLCEITSLIGTILIPISILYSFIRRFATKSQQWDFFGVYLSVLLYLIIWLLLMSPPWLQITYLCEKIARFLFF